MTVKLKHLVAIPLLIFLLSLFVLFNNYRTTGDFIQKDVDLKGGTLITIESNSPIDAKLIETQLREKYGSVLVSSLKTFTGYGVSIAVESSVDANSVVNDVKNSGVVVSSFAIETVGPALGSLFWKQVVRVVIVGFVLMSVIIFFAYRTPFLSFSVIFSILANIVGTLALSGLIGIKINLAAFAGLLMLIAYSVDSNIVLASNALKSETKEFNVTYRKALKTGMTMTACIIATMVVVILLSTSNLLTTLASVLVIGFLLDIPNTWVLNSFLIEKYLERKKR